MSIQSAITVELLVAKEASQGVLPGGAKFRKLDRVSGTLSLEKDAYSSARIRSDRQKAYSRHGVRRATGQLRDELSIGGSDLFLEGAVGGAWANGTTKTGTFSIDEDGVLSGAPNAFAGLFAGLVVLVSGLVDQAEAEPITAKIVAVSADFSSIQLEKRAEIAADWEVEVDTAAVSVAVAGRTLKNGKVDNSYTFENFYPEIASAKKYLRSVGVKVDSAAFDLPPTGLASVTYTLRGLNQTAETATLDASPLEPIAGSLLAAVNGACRIAEEDGVAEKIALLTAFSFNTANGLAGDPVVGSNFVPKLFDGAIAVTGSMTAYMEDMKFVEYFDDEKEVSIDVELAGETIAEFLGVVFGRVKINSATITADGTGGATIAANWEALLDPKSGAMIVFQSSHTG